MSVTNTAYKTLNFSKTLSLVLDQDTEIDLLALKEFLDRVEKGEASSVRLGPYVSINTKSNTLVIQGYPIANGWMASGKSDKYYTVSFDPTVDKVTLVLYYLYHMAVTV
jgi:hypothetical protein